jgi:hypothetical protein
VLEHARDLVAPEDHRQPGWCARLGNVGEKRQIGAQHFAVEEEQGRLGLILRGRRDLAVYSQVRQERLDLLGSHIRRVALVMKQDEAFNPAAIGVLGTDAVVLDADDVPDLTKQ